MKKHEEIKNSDNLIYQNDEILIVLDIDPISEGHILILPQVHYKDIDELPLTLLFRIMEAAQKYMSLLKAKYSPKGFSMMQNGGDYNDIDVFHLHVFPRFNNDDFNWKSELKQVVQINILELKASLKSELEGI